MTTPIQPAAFAAVAPTRAASPSALADGGPAFSDLLSRVLGDTSDLERGAQQTIEAFLRGDPVELHQVMAASEEASIALELLVELRNKLADAYRTVMNIQ